MKALEEALQRFVDGMHGKLGCPEDWESEVNQAHRALLGQEVTL